MTNLMKLVFIGGLGFFFTQHFHYLIDKKFEELNEGETPSFVTMAQREKELDCLTKNIYYEAGIENFEGKVAVAQVTLNRTKSDKFPNNICAVVYERNLIYNNVICQFSWYCDSKVKVRPINQAAYKESEAVAKKVLLEGFRLNIITEDILYYHADYINPKWKRKRVTKIGRHIFYKG
jgi:spore germination cell wall hydrolase CwlJ-like protein